MQQKSNPNSAIAAYIVIASSALIICGCFLPWIQWDKIIIHRGIDNGDGAIMLVAGVITIIVGSTNLQKKQNRYRLIPAIAIMTSIFFCYYYITLIIEKQNSLIGKLAEGFDAFTNGNRELNIYDYIGSGLYIIILGSFGLFISLFFKNASQNEFYDNKNSGLDNYPNQSFNSNIEKDNLLDKLSQLYLLKENGVITQEIYEVERQNILAKFPQSDKDDNNQELVIEKESSEKVCVIIEPEHDPIYQELFNKKTWLQKNKNILIIFFIIIGIGVTIYCCISTSTSYESNQKNNYIVNNISMHGISINDPKSDLDKINLKVIAHEKNIIKYESENGNDFSITIQKGKIVYMENDWSEEVNAEHPLFSDFKFGQTSLKEMQDNLGTNGFTYTNQISQTTDADMIKFNCFEFDSPNNEVLVLITKAPLQTNQTENQSADNFKLDAVIIANEAYLDKIWGSEKVFDSAYKKIKL
ncbi:MAG TPA: hypothetical protein VK705_00730 [Ferruginibacter sp.]|nr:hypothetical protein [Ferruginibacter sp.]